MASLVDVLLSLPLASGVVWLANAAWPWVRGLRTPPERAFVALCVFLGVWALLDWLFLHTTALAGAIPTVRDADLAVLLANFRNSFLTLASLAFFYFGRWLTRQRTRIDVIAAVPALGALAIYWAAAPTGVVFDDLGPRLIRDPGWYAIWIAQVAAYFLVAFYYIGRTIRGAVFASPATRAKLIVIFVGFLATLVITLAMTAYANVAQARPIPLFSAILLIPGVLILLFFAPESTERLVSMFRRLMLAPARPFSAIWYYNSGQPLAQILLPGEKSLDVAVLADLARAVEHVVTTGLRSETGSLREMAAGDVRFLFERGRYLTLVVLLRGRPSEALRAELRLAVRDFEEAHRDRLGTWESAADLAESALRSLDEVLNPTML